MLADEAFLGTLTGLTKTQALSGKWISCFDCMGGSSFPYFPPMVTAIDFDGCLSVYRNTIFPGTAKRVFLGSLCREAIVTWMSPQDVTCPMERCDRHG